MRQVFNQVKDKAQQWLRQSWNEGALAGGLCWGKGQGLFKHLCRISYQAETAPQA